jgi:uroporphyrinogen-III synthase
VVVAIETGTIDGVILMSPRTASILTRLVRAQGLATPMSRVNCYCISQAVAQELAPLRTSAIVAAHPSEDDVLALLATETAS